jgi:hypothetical protein
MNAKTRFITINFNNGKKQKFEFLPIADDPSVMTSKLEKMVASGVLMFHCEDRVHIIPLNSVESMEVSPAPDKLPGFVVQALREIE